MITDQLITDQLLFTQIYVMLKSVQGYKLEFSLLTNDLCGIHLSAYFSFRKKRRVFESKKCK